MAAKPVDKKEDQKLGLLALGFKPGESLPFLEGSGVPNKVGPKGELLWQVRDAVLAWLEKTYELRQHLIRKRGEVLMALFRMWNLFTTAANYLPVHPLHVSFSPLNAPYDPGVVTEFEEAPHNVQQAVWMGALKYLGFS